MRYVIVHFYTVTLSNGMPVTVYVRFFVGYTLLSYTLVHSQEVFPEG